MSGGQQELQALSEQLQQLQETIEVLQGTIEGIRAERSAVQEAIDAIETLESGSTIQVPLGGGAYVRATVEDIDDVIVELGDQYGAAFERTDATDALSRKQERLDERIEEVTDRIGELEANRTQLEDRARGLQQQALQQQMGSMAGQADDE